MVSCVVGGLLSRRFADHGIAGQVAREEDARPNGNVPNAAHGSEVKAMYRDPKTGETWSGRGRMATWLKRKQDAGEEIDDYLV